MNTCKVLLQGAILALTVASSAQAITVSSSVSNVSNLWYYSQDDGAGSDLLGFSPDAGAAGSDAYRYGGRSTIFYDYWDHKGVAASQVSGTDFTVGSTLNLSISGSVPYAAYTGEYDADGQVGSLFGDLTFGSVVGVWAEAIASDGSFTALDLDSGAGTLFDFNVGSSFSAIIPDNAVALFLGYVSPNIDEVITAGSSLYREFNVSANVTAVPVPAGIWLLASGLLMFGSRKIAGNRKLTSA